MRGSPSGVFDFFHQGMTNCLGYATLDLSLDILRINRTADIVGRHNAGVSVTSPISSSTSTSTICVPKGWRDQGTRDEKEPRPRTGPEPRVCA